jgi:hypothetical protein
MKLRLLLALVFLLHSLGAGAQTTYGPGGLFIHPTASVRPEGSLGLNVSWFEQKVPGRPLASWLPVSVIVGVDGRTEVGATYLRRLDLSSNASSGGVFVKHQFARQTERSPAVAVAASYLGGGVQLSSVSLVASHRFGPGERSVTGHLGTQWAGRADISKSEDDGGIFAGIEAPLARRLALVAEYGTRFSFDYKERTAIGLVWREPNGYQVGVGAVNVGRSGGNRFFIGVGFPLGGN